MRDRIRAVLFDLDGTLLDTSPGSIDSVMHTIDILNLKRLDQTELYSFVGPPIQESFKRHFFLDDSEAIHAADVFRSYYKEHSLYMAVLYPGITELLALLKASSILIGVATYKREDYAIPLLEKFGIADFCDSIRGADSACLLKKKDILQLCLTDLGISTNECIMVGDTEHDALGADSLGIRFIGVGYGFGFKTQSDISRYRHISFAETPKDLLQYMALYCNETFRMCEQ